MTQRTVLDELISNRGLMQSSSLDATPLIDISREAAPAAYQEASDRYNLNEMAKLLDQQNDNGQNPASLTIDQLDQRYANPAMDTVQQKLDTSSASQIGGLVDTASQLAQAEIAEEVAQTNIHYNEAKLDVLGNVRETLAEKQKWAKVPALARAVAGLVYGPATMDYYDTKLSDNASALAMLDQAMLAENNIATAEAMGTAGYNPLVEPVLDRARGIAKQYQDRVLESRRIAASLAGTRAQRDNSLIELAKLNEGVRDRLAKVYQTQLTESGENYRAHVGYAEELIKANSANDKTTADLLATQQRAEEAQQDYEIGLLDAKNAGDKNLISSREADTNALNAATAVRNAETEARKQALAEKESPTKLLNETRSAVASLLTSQANMNQAVNKANENLINQLKLSQPDKPLSTKERIELREKFAKLSNALQVSKAKADTFSPQIPVLAALSGGVYASPSLTASAQLYQNGASQLSNGKTLEATEALNSANELFTTSLSEALAQEPTESGKLMVQQRLRYGGSLPDSAKYLASSYFFDNFQNSASSLSVEGELFNKIKPSVVDEFMKYWERLAPEQKKSLVPNGGDVSQISANDLLLALLRGDSASGPTAAKLASLIPMPTVLEAALNNPKGISLTSGETATTASAINLYRKAIKANYVNWFYDDLANRYLANQQVYTSIKGIKSDASLATDTERLNSLANLLVSFGYASDVPDVLTSFSKESTVSRWKQAYRQNSVVYDNPSSAMMPLLGFDETSALLYSGLNSDNFVTAINQIITNARKRSENINVVNTLNKESTNGNERRTN